MLAWVMVYMLLLVLPCMLAAWVEYTLVACMMALARYMMELVLLPDSLFSEDCCILAS